MNVYDTANRLASEIKNSEEYANFKMARETVKMNKDLENKIKEFNNVRYDAQLTAMQTGKNDEEKLKKVQDLYVELIEKPEAKQYFDAETKFNILVADVNKIIGEAIQDVMN